MEVLPLYSSAAVVKDMIVPVLHQHHQLLSSLDLRAGSNESEHIVPYMILYNRVLSSQLVHLTFEVAHKKMDN